MKHLNVNKDGKIEKDVSSGGENTNSNTQIHTGRDYDSLTNLVNDGGAPAVEYILDVSELM